MQNWKELQNFAKIKCEYKLPTADDIISSIESVRLNVKVQA